MEPMPAFIFLGQKKLGSCFWLHLFNGAGVRDGLPSGKSKVSGGDSEDRRVV